MDIDARNQHPKALQEKCLMTKSRKEKPSIPDEYYRNTGQNRKYIIRKIQSFHHSPPKRRKRKRVYNSYLRTTLAKVWEVFDFPWGQGLEDVKTRSVESPGLRKYLGPLF